MLTNLKRLYTKTLSIFERGFRALRLLPERLVRLFRHIGSGLNLFFVQNQRQTQHWWQDFAFLVFDLVALPELYETLFDFVKWNTRPLSRLERKLAASVFGNAIRLDEVRIDDYAKFGCKKRNIVYVSYMTINSWGRIRPETFIHELVHVWQFQQMGGAYIPQALRAQRTKEGYNYGGASHLKEAMQSGRKLTDFNLEQQADLICDYFSIKKGLKPTWGKGAEVDLPVYLYFVSQLHS